MANAESSKRKSADPKRGTRGRRIVRRLLLIAAAFTFADAVFGEQGLLATRRARQEYDGLSASIVRQRTENDRLREAARRLREDPSAIEELARRELGLIRPGEKVFIVKDLAPASVPSRSDR